MVFMVVCEMVVCEMGGGCSLLSVALVCLLFLLGSTSPCGACGMHEIACACLSACSSGVRVVSVCAVFRVLRFVRVFVSLLVEQGRA